MTATQSATSSSTTSSTLRGTTRTEPTAREARKVAEAAREQDWTKPSFGKELFLGRLRLDLIEGGDHRLSNPADLERLVEAVEVMRG